MLDAAPRLIDFLDAESLAHFNGLRRLLDHANVPYQVNARLVRGMDYYNRTVFEWTTKALGAQGTICGGGRYDPLMALSGARHPAAIGFAVGIERVLELMKAGGENWQRSECDVYVVHQGETAQLQALVAAERLRTAGLDVILHCAALGSGAGFKQQMKRADTSGANFAIIIGDDEVAAQSVTLKFLRSANGTSEQTQRSVPFEQIVDAIVDAMTGAHAHHHDHTHLHP